MSTPAAPEAQAAAKRLRITEIFYSLQGEARTVGVPTVFVRLTGCPLRCGYCDTEYAFHEGEWLGFDEILTRVEEFAPRYVCVTGGEPLAQRPCRELLQALCDRGYSVSLETGGAFDIADIDPRVSIVMDLKTPGSSEVEKNLYGNIAHLQSKDQVKFVICDRNDYEWSRDKVREYRLDQVCEILFSPSHEQQDARELADWILADRLPVRMQIQLHKVLWRGERGR